MLSCMYEYHGWVSLRDSAGDDDELVSAATVTAVTELLDASSLCVYLADVREVNGAHVVTVAGFPNHAPADVLETYCRIAELAPGSYGVLDVYDDEAGPATGDGFRPDDNNTWFSYVMARGTVRRHRNPWLSPHVPTVEDAYPGEDVDDRRTGFADAAALWAADARGADVVVGAAAELLAGGADGPALAELAGEPTRRLAPDFRAKVRAALEEQGLPAHEPHTDEAQLAALRALARQMLADRLPPRELARWAHVSIGHSGPVAAQTLVELDDVYDEMPWTSATVEETDAKVRAEARRLIESSPKDMP